ncbi:TetR/AcrR family transcriptional regulator [Acuticoccus mangrovi]|uniref:TetR family transcriptional regulator n=1 Tax=Acuticoccus mangrovi TaxID=2796142 RepID=A0A934INP5_9HYPH|nr:TetR family transcriptional regulator [Acuticoccus mangrovi]
MTRRSTTRDPERTRRHILDAARAAFAHQGLDGARVDAIAEASGVNKRMIYYYFDDKEGLFLAVLEEIYAELSAAGEAMDLAAPPLDALTRYVDFVWTYYHGHPEVIAILNNENLHGGAHLARSLHIRELERPFIDKLARLLQQGEEKGAFRPGLDPVTIHITVIALVYLFLGNNRTLSIFFDRDLSTAVAKKSWREHIQCSVRAIVTV